MKTIIIKAKILSTKYKCTSYTGNNCYYVSFEDENGKQYKGQTALNASCGISVHNYLNKGFVNVKYHTTRTGTVIIDAVNKD